MKVILWRYQCQICRRFFYIEWGDKQDFDVSFGCPYGCDDSGRFIERVSREVKKIRGQRRIKI